MNTTISITANGKAFTIDPGSSLPDFLASLELTPERVVVERNGQALTPADVRKTQLQDGDSLEIIRIVAGG